MRVYKFQLKHNKEHVNCGLKLERDYNSSIVILGKGLASAGEDWLQFSMNQEALCESAGQFTMYN